MIAADTKRAIDQYISLAIVEFYEVKCLVVKTTVFIMSLLKITIDYIFVKMINKSHFLEKNNYLFTKIPANKIIKSAII